MPETETETEIDVSDTAAEALASVIVTSFALMTSDDNPASPALAESAGLPTHPAGADQELAEVGQALGRFFAAARDAGLTATEAANKIRAVTICVEAVLAVADPHAEALLDLVRNL